MEDQNINPIDERRRKIELYKEMRRRQNVEDWKARLFDEYRQTKERYEKLKKFNNKREIACRCEIPQAYDSEYDCRKTAEQRSVENTRTYLLSEQQRAMELYLHFLELRMELEGIEY